MEIKVVRKILAENDAQAAANRRRLTRARVAAVNLMGSPGCGKTSLLEALRAAAPRLRLGVMEGDIATTADAERMAACGIPVVQINTDRFGSACHLAANMVSAALDALPLEDLDILVIENIGNLICPGEFDLGEHRRVVVASVAEGPEKPLKYPLMFRRADLVLVNKVDLGRQAGDAAQLCRNVRKVNTDGAVIRTSARTGLGLRAWARWLRRLHAELFGKL